MAVTTDQYNRLLSRLTALENAHNDVVVAMEAFITLEQMNQLLTLLQTDTSDLNTQVAALNERVEAIENEPLT
tara:strand:+ start:152 stop:370 length:219 start_codon:yes stop_codon:yes gene_type:complete